MNRMFQAIWGIAAVLAAAAVAWVAADSWARSELASARRALDARASELTQRALVPGSPLACLDAVANDTLEAACEKVLFANPETTAAAVAYIDAKIGLLADSAAFAERDLGYAASLERLRRGLEADRYGVVAQALASRGCTVEACPALKLLRDPRRVTANLKERVFDAHVVLNASAWRPEAAALAAAPPGASPPPSAPTIANAPAGTPSRYEFPSSASIPPVSIMNAEPPLSKSEEAALAAPAPAPAAPAATKAQPARKATPRETTAQPLPPPAPVAPNATR